MSNEEQSTGQKIPAPTQAANPAVKLSAKAHLTWRDKLGKIVKEEDVYRSLPSLNEHLCKRMADAPESAEQTVHINVPPEVDAKAIGQNVLRDSEGNELELVIADGPLGDVIAKIQKETMSPSDVFYQLSAALQQLCDLSSFKGAIVTFVCEGAKVGGTGFLTESSELAAEDILALADAAGNQVQLFKDKMTASRGLKFADDDGGIVTAAQARTEGQVIA